MSLRSESTVAGPTVYAITPPTLAPHPPECVFVLTSEELSAGEPVSFNNNEFTAQLNDYGELVFDFPQGKEIAELAVQTDTGKQLQV